MDNLNEYFKPFLIAFNKIFAIEFILIFICMPLGVFTGLNLTGDLLVDLSSIEKISLCIGLSLLSNILFIIPFILILLSSLKKSFGEVAIILSLLLIFFIQSLSLLFALLLMYFLPAKNIGSLLYALAFLFLLVVAHIVYFRNRKALYSLINQK